MILDDREMKILQMVARGRRHDYIAKEMGWSLWRLGRELGHLYAKIGVDCPVAAALWYDREVCHK